MSSESRRTRGGRACVSLTCSHARRPMMKSRTNGISLISGVRLIRASPSVSAAPVNVSLLFCLIRRRGVEVPFLNRCQEKQICLCTISFVSISNERHMHSKESRLQRRQCTSVHRHPFVWQPLQQQVRRRDGGEAEVTEVATAPRLILHLSFAFIIDNCFSPLLAFDVVSNTGTRKKKDQNSTECLESKHSKRSRSHTHTVYFNKREATKILPTQC